MVDRYFHRQLGELLTEALEVLRAEREAVCEPWGDVVPGHVREVLNEIDEAMRSIERAQAAARRIPKGAA